jgi:hypothetical protein
MKIKLNADNLRKKIKDIRDLADRADTARTQIDAAFERESDPVSPDDFLTQSNDGIQRVRTVADKVEKSMNTIISLNENGVGKMEGDDYTLDIPDDAHVTDMKTLDDWAGKEQAKVDAEDLKEYTSKGTGHTKRSYDEVIASIERHKTNSQYAGIIIDSLGAENLTQIPLNMDLRVNPDVHRDSPKSLGDLAALLGDVLSSASREWDDKKSSDVANKIVDSIKDPADYQRVKVLNAMMGGHDADGNGVNDLKFGKSFLVNLATEAEKLDYKTTIDHNAERGYRAPLDLEISQQSADPLAGILDAMGNNDEAALEFLAPAKSGEPGTADTARLDKLTHRWDELKDIEPNALSQYGFSGLTAAIAAASKLRASTDAAERSRADMLSDDAIHFVAGNVSKDLYDDSSKKRLAMLLANCSGEVTASWSTEGGRLAATDKPPFNKATGDDLNKLAYRIVDNRDAASTLSAGLANYAKNESQRGLLNNDNQPEELRLQGIRDPYANGIKAVSHLQGLGEIRAQQLKEDKDAAAAAAKESTTTAVNVFSAVLSTGLGAVGGPAGTAVTTTAPVVTAFANPVIIDNLTGDAGKAKKVTSNVPSDSKEAIWAASVQDAANAGLLQESDFSTPVKHRDKDGHDVETPAHDYYKWIVPKPGGGYTIDLSKGGDNAAAELGTWAKTARDANADRNVGDGEQPPIDKNLSFLEPDGKTGDGKAEGETAGRSLKGNGG